MSGPERAFNLMSKVTEGLSGVGVVSNLTTGTSSVFVASPNSAETQPMPSGASSNSICHQVPSSFLPTILAVKSTSSKPSLACVVSGPERTLSFTSVVKEAPPGSVVDLTNSTT